jgi:hypothetical protein
MLFALIASDVIERKRLAAHLAILFRSAFATSDDARPQVR